MYGGWKPIGDIYIIYIYIPAPSKRSLLEAFVDLQVAGGDLLEGPGIVIYVFYNNISRAGPCLDSYRAGGPRLLISDVFRSP